MARWKFRHLPEALRLLLLGVERTIHGGPFDAFAPPAIGVCLETRSAQAHLARVVIDIADFAAPGRAVFETGLAEILRAMRAQPDAAVYVGCRAGLGRTGTVLAGLAKLAGIAEPVAWVRAQYDARAVETAEQEAAVAALDVAAVWARLDGA